MRQHSEDRNAKVRDVSREKGPKEGSKLQPSLMRETKDNNKKDTLSSSYQGGGHSFLTNLKSSATKGAGAIHKGLFGKSVRSASTTEKELQVDDEHYELKVINKPLVEQTRLTRISKRLEDSRDKTEFWMPSFPWRAIDYLNYKGSDVEGLYRVPGSGPQIKKWQRRFDEGKSNQLCDHEGIANNLQNSILTSLSKTISTISTLLAPCLKLGSVNSPTNSSPSQPKIASPENVPGQRRFPNN